MEKNPQLDLLVFPASNCDFISTWLNPCSSIVRSVLRGDLGLGARRSAVRVGGLLLDLPSIEGSVEPDQTTSLATSWWTKRYSNQTKPCWSDPTIHEPNGKPKIQTASEPTRNDKWEALRCGVWSWSWKSLVAIKLGTSACLPPAGPQ